MSISCALQRWLQIILRNYAKNPKQRSMEKAAAAQANLKKGDQNRFSSTLFSKMKS
jgi:hypothetical protein